MHKARTDHRSVRAFFFPCASLAGAVVRCFWDGVQRTENAPGGLGGMGNILIVHTKKYFYLLRGSLRFGEGNWSLERHAGDCRLCEMGLFDSNTSTSGQGVVEG